MFLLLIGLNDFMNKVIAGFLFIVTFASSISAQIKEARIIDKFGNVSCDDYLSRMDNFWSNLNNSPNAKGYIFIYEGKLATGNYDKKGKYVGNKYISPKIGEAKERIKTMKTRLELSKYSLEKITFIEAGFRDKYAVEFWVVPDDVIPPKPSPTLDKIKFRKGKPQNFCSGF